MLAPQGLCYFDSLDETDPTNTLARLIALDASARVAAVESAQVDARGSPHQFSVHANARDYLFGVSSADEARAWVDAIEKACRSPAAFATAQPEGAAPVAKDVKAPNGEASGAASALSKNVVEATNVRLVASNDAAHAHPPAEPSTVSPALINAEILPARRGPVGCCLIS